MVNYTALQQVNSVQSDEKCLITVNVHITRDVISLFCTKIMINLFYVFKMSAFGKNAVFSVVNATGQWMHQLCIVQCYAKRLPS